MLVELEQFKILYFFRLVVSLGIFENTTHLSSAFVKWLLEGLAHFQYGYHEGHNTQIYENASRYTYPLYSFPPLSQ